MLGLIKSESAETPIVEAAALTSFYRQMSGFCTTLIDLRDEFEGDMDRFLVYLIVMLDDVSRVASGSSGKGGGVSALSIAEITRIPRETVRRKVGLLVSSGMLRREGYAHYHLTENADSPKLIERFAKLVMSRTTAPAAAPAPPIAAVPGVPPLRRAAGGYAVPGQMPQPTRLRWD